MKKLIGDKIFYKMALAVALPIIIQNGITSFVGLLDNIMIGQVGTLPMSGVSISNQLINVYNIAIFGAVSGAGIFSAQFCGKKDIRGVQYCFRFKILIGCLILGISLLVFGFYGKPLIQMYLASGVNEAEEAALTLNYGWSYMKIMMLGLFPFLLVTVYSSSLRENGETVLPMISSLCAVFTNFILNYILIFGHFNFPALGIEGAAIATVISRFCELFVIAFFSHIQKEKYVFLQGIYKECSIPLELARKICIKGAPLLLNEVLWSAGMAAIVQCYSTRGLNAVAAMNITTTVTNLFMIVCYAMGNAISIIVGQKLGAGKKEEAQDVDAKLIAFAFMLCVLAGSALFFCAPFIPQIYNTTDQVKKLATVILRISACTIPLYSLYYGSYFTLRCGGNTMLTFLFDSFYTCIISLPAAFLLSRFSSFNIVIVYLLVQCMDIPKAILGLYLVKKGIWINTIVTEVK